MAALTGCFFYFFFSGSWARITAQNISIQPESSLMESRSPSTMAPESAANTDSKLIKSEATAGSTCACPIIWNVYASPHEKIPA